jgi:hypothetical protein
VVGPPDHTWSAEPAFPTQALLTPEGRGAAVGPRELLGAVVGGEHNHGVVRDAKRVELVEQLTDDPVELLQAVGVEPERGLVSPALRQVRPHVHPRGVVPQEEGLVAGVSTIDEVERPAKEVVFDRLHPLAGQRPGVFDGLASDPTEPWVLGGIVNVGRLAVQ